MSDRYPITIDQARELQTDLTGMLNQSAEILQLLTAAYGDSDRRAVRAWELNASVQRLIAELDRATRTQAAGSPVGN